MAIPDLSIYKPAAGTDVDAEQVANGFTTIEDALANIGDESKMSWKSGKIIDLSQFKTSGASANQVPVYNGTSLLWEPQTITDLFTFYTKESDTDITTTVADQDAFGSGFTIGANKWKAHGKVVIEAGGTYLSPTSSRTLQLKLKLGSTTLWDSNTSLTSINSNAARRAWWMRVVLQSTGGVTYSSAQRGSGKWELGYFTPVATTGTGMIFEVNGSGVAYAAPFTILPSAVDMTTGQTLKLLVSHGAGAGTMSFLCSWGRVEVYA